MAETLASIIDRCEVFLADKTNISWSTETMTECIRLALTEINQAAGATYTIDDLDLADATTLPAGDTTALIFGVAAYAVKNRAVDRMEKPSLGEGPEAGLTAWGDWAQACFKKNLAVIRKRALNESTSAPHSELDWTEEPHKW